MTNDKLETPTITDFQPQVSDDNQRVTLELKVANLPTLTTNVRLMMAEGHFSAPPQEDDNLNPPSFPNVVLSILDEAEQELAGLFIVEHQEPHISLTLHLPSDTPPGSYVAQAEMSYQDELLDVARASFELPAHE